MLFQMRFRTLFTLLLSLIVPAGSAPADICLNFENFYNTLLSTGFRFLYCISLINSDSFLEICSLDCFFEYVLPLILYLPDFSYIFLHLS